MRTCRTARRAPPRPPRGHLARHAAPVNRLNSVRTGTAAPNRRVSVSSQPSSPRRPGSNWRSLLGGKPLARHGEHPVGLLALRPPPRQRRSPPSGLAAEPSALCAPPSRTASLRSSPRFASPLPQPTAHPARPRHRARSAASRGSAATAPHWRGRRCRRRAPGAARAGNPARAPRPTSRTPSTRNAVPVG